MVQLARVALFALIVGGCHGGGAPATQPTRVVTTDTTVEIFDPITFTGEADLAPTSAKILDAVASTFEGNPGIKLVEVQAHVADGDAAKRQELADRRAKVVIDALVSRHVAPDRLQPKGLVTPGASTTNPNTVSFVILKRG